MKPLEYMEVEDIEVLEVLNNPVRIRILRHLQEPRSVKEVAERLDVPTTRLYYHFNLLEEAGIVAVVETRKVGAMLEKVFQVTAQGFRPSAKLARGNYEPHELAKITAGVVLDGARVDAEEALTDHFASVRAGEEAPRKGLFGRSVAFVTAEQAETFSEKLKKLIEEEFDTLEEPKGREYGLTYVFFPLAGTGERD